MPNPPEHTPFRSQTAGVVNMHTISHANTLLQNLEPYPPPRPGDHPLFPYLSLAVSLSSLPLSHLCLCGAAAAQRTEGAAFTSEHISHQMSPFAASPSNIQADNAPCILNIWLTTSPTKGAGWRSGLREPRLVELKATSTVTPTACLHTYLSGKSSSCGINTKRPPWETWADKGWDLSAERMTASRILHQKPTIYYLHQTFDSDMCQEFWVFTCFFLYPKYVWAAQRSESCGEMLSDNPDVASDTCNRSAAVTLRVSNLRSERETATQHVLHCTHRDTRRRPSRRSRSET